MQALRAWQLQAAVLIGYVAIALFLFLPACSGSMPAPGDSFTYNIPLRAYYSEFASKGWSLWLPYVFAGTCFLGTLQTGLLYPPNFLYFIASFEHVFNFSLIAHYVLAAYGVFLLCRHLKLSPLAAFAGGMSFAFSGFLMAHKGHVSMVNAASWAPLLVFLVEWFRETRRWSVLPMAALVVGMQILAGHYQISVYSYVFLGISYIIGFRTSDRKSRRHLAVFLALSVVGGSLIALPQLIATRRLASVSNRAHVDSSFAAGLSYRPWWIPSLVSPFLFDEWTEGAGFTGFLVLGFAVVTCVRLFRKHRAVSTYAILLLISFLLALGRYGPLHPALCHVPIYSSFRVPARNLLFVNLAISVLFAIGFHRFLIERRDGAYRRPFMLFIAVAVLVSAVSLLIHAARGNAGHVGMRPIITPLFFAASYFCLAYRAQRLYAQSGLLALLLLFLLEIYSFAHFQDDSWVSPIHMQEVFKSNTLKFLGDQEGLHRTVLVTDETFPLHNVPARVQFLNGYDPLMIADCGELLTMQPNGVSKQWNLLLQNNKLISALNVRYVIIPAACEDYARYLRVKGAGTGFPADLHQQVIFSGQILHNSEEQADHAEAAVNLLPGIAYVMDWTLSSERPTASLHVSLLRGEETVQCLTIRKQDISKSPKRIVTMLSAGAHVDTITVTTRSRNPIHIGSLKIHPAATEALPYRLVYEDSSNMIFENTGVLPRAFSVTSVVEADSLSSIKATIFLDEVDVSQTALVYPEDYRLLSTVAFANGKSHVLQYRPDELVINCSFAEEGFLVVSDQYYPGWVARIGSKELQIMRVNGIMRGILVPKGEFTLRLTYEPKDVVNALRVSAAAIVSCTLAMVLLLNKEGSRAKKLG